MSSSLTPLSVEEFGQVLSVYNEVTEQLKSSHDRLQKETARLRDELASKNKQLEQSSRLAGLGEMAAGIAHEIRNPLQGIRLYADMLRDDLQDSDSPLNLVEKISSAVTTLDHMVSDVLAFSHAEACQKTDIRFGAVLDQIVDLLTPLCDQASVTMRIQPNIGELPVRGEAQLIGRMLLNLLTNALDAAGPAGTIEVEARRECGPSPGLEIRISDNGPGFSQAASRRMFDPFFTTKDCGTGIGLSIVYRIVESHGGSIQAGNLPDGGAIVSVRLPDEDQSRRTH
jgi:signal transduction histidine kinase